MGNYTIFYMFENPRRGRQARNCTKNVSKILDLRIVFRTDIFRKLTLGTPDTVLHYQKTEDPKRNHLP